jgi:uridylate kinase
MLDKKHIIISLGGSLIIPDEVDSSFLREFIGTIKEYVKNGYKFVIITGGGRLCRRYQHAFEDIEDTSNEQLDWLGIHSTRFNAEFVRLLFGDLAHNEIILNPNIIPETDKPIILGGGWKPGWSTDYDAVIIAKILESEKVINLSNIDYAYDKDPKQYPDAKPIKNISWEDFRAFFPKEWDPGLNAPFDPIAAKEAEELGVEVAIMNGKNIDNFKKYLDGGEFVGTVIR